MPKDRHRSRSRSRSRKTPSPTMAQKEKLAEIMMLHTYILPRNNAMKRSIHKNRKGGKRRRTYKK